MMDKKLLLKLLEDIMTVAEGAYWQTYEHLPVNDIAKHEEVYRAIEHFKRMSHIVKEVNKL